MIPLSLSHQSRKAWNRLGVSQLVRTTPSRIRRSFRSLSSDADQVTIEDHGRYEVILPEEPYVWGTSHIKRRSVPQQILRPPYVDSHSPKSPEGFREEYSGDGRIRLGSEDELRLRKAAKLARSVLHFAGTLVREGVTTDEIDSQIHQFIISHSAYPSPLMYAGFPKASCTSVNNIVAHGIPDERPLQDGDIVNIDITVYLDGFHGDTSRMFLVGNVDPIGHDLVDVTNEALNAAIEVCGPGRPFKGIAKTIREVIGDKPFSVCSQFTGHGIGTVFHRPPWILHDLNDEPGEMLPGHCFTIEPCIVVGSDPSAWVFPDGWTASTVTGARSAQAEHMILITENGADVLTRD